MSAFPPKEDLFSPQRLRDNWNSAATREKAEATVSPEALPRAASPSEAVSAEAPSFEAPASSEAPASQALRAPHPTTVLISELCQRIDESVVGADNRFMQHALDCLREASELPPGEELALALDMVEDLLDESVIRSP